MADVFAWRFIIFTLLFAGMLYLQFYVAHRQWKKVKGQQAQEIDVGYVRMEDYLAQSFRRKVKDWLKLPAETTSEQGRTILKGSETIRVSTAADYGAGEHCDDILVVEGDFKCGPDCVFSREILVKGNATIGAGSRLQSMAVEGNLSMGDNVKVARWLDSARESSIGFDCLIGARLTSQGLIRLGAGVQAASIYSPQVATVGWDGSFQRNGAGNTSALPEIAFAEDMSRMEESLEAAGFEVKKLIALGSDCWLYKGNLRPLKALRLKSKLVVKGDCELPDGCVLEEDLRADGSLVVGANSVCRGNLIAGRDIELGTACWFSGLIHAEGSVQLGRGTRGVKDDGLVVAYAGVVLRVERDVAVKGKLTAGERVIVESAEALQAKRSSA